MNHCDGCPTGRHSKHYFITDDRAGMHREQYQGFTPMHRADVEVPR